MTHSIIANSLLFLCLTGSVLYVYLILGLRTERALSGLIVNTALLALAHFIGVPLVLSWLHIATPAWTFACGTLVLGAVMLGARLRLDEIRNGTRTICRLGTASLGRLKRFRLVHIPFYIFVGVMLYKTGVACLIRPYTCDAHAYHLPTALNVLDNGYYAEIQGSRLAVVAWHPFMNGFGKNMSFIFFWILAISRNEFFLLFPSLLSGPVGVAAVYRVCRRFNVSRDAALFAAPLALFSYFGIIQMTTCMVDQMMAALSAIACLWCLRPLRFYSTFGLSLACGLLAGSSRFTVLVVCGATLVFYFGRFLTERDQAPPGAPTPIQRLIRHGALAIVILLLFGSHQFLHNLSMHANPLYPYGFKMARLKAAGLTSWQSHIRSSYGQMAGRSELAGFFPSILRVWARGFTHSTRVGGWGLLFPLVMLPAHLIALASRRRDRRYIAYVLLLWLTFFGTPQYYWLRYTLHFFMLSALPVAVCIDRPTKARPVACALIGILAFVTAGHASLQLGYRGTTVRSWLQYLRTESPCRRNLFLNKNPSIETACAIHERGIARDVVYTTHAYKYAFRDKSFRNRVVPYWYETDKDLLGFLQREDLEQAAVVTTRGWPQERALRDSPLFRQAHGNGRESVFVLNTRNKEP